MTERKFIESIRQQRSEGSDFNLEDLANSVEILAIDLNEKDTHFIFELIQNAEDNDYRPNTSPSLRIEVCEQEIEEELGPVLIVHNNETGFQEKHVMALCRVGKSTKTKAQGYIGEKGIGFKSVFRVTTCPYIFSNGFQFCLPEHNKETILRYIVPRWVDDPPAKVIESETTIILPINRGEDALHNVIKALRDIAPETVLFLEKLRTIEISVHLSDDDYEVVIEKRILAVSGESKQVELTYLRRSNTDAEVLESCLYWVTEVEYPKPDYVQHEKRKGIKARTVSVAIPLGPNARGGKLLAYLPVWENTGLPFLINADFLLVSAREGIHEEEKWNKWLRDCIAETYEKALLSLLKATDLPLETRIRAYASIPLASHLPFLALIVKPIQERLKNQECVLVLPNRALAKPSRARLCPGDFRSLLGLPDSFPRYLREDAWLVCSELEPFDQQLKAIGVQLFTEVISCLKDTAWLQRYGLAWFIDLLRYLRGQKFDPTNLRSIAVIPIEHAEQDTLRLSCDAEQPIYLSRTEADQETLDRVPVWLSALVPVAFLDSNLLGLIDQQPDGGAVRKWLWEVLNVWDFSIRSFCIDLSSKLQEAHARLDDNRLVEATIFLAQHAGPSFDWGRLPILLSNGQRLRLQEAQLQPKEIVVPEDFKRETSWQNIWSTPQDRTHFLVLAPGYQSLPPEWFEKRQIRRYPRFRQVTYSSQPEDSWKPQFFRDCQREAAEARSDETRVISYAFPSTQISDSLSRSLLQLMKTLDIPSEYSSDYDNKMHQLGFRAKGVYQYHGEKTKYGDSDVLQKLRTLKWLPSSKGFVAPSDAFLPKPGIKEIFGDTIPYFEGDLPEGIRDLLRIHSDVTVDDLLDQLRKASNSTDSSLDFAERIYSQLHARTRSYSYDMPARFAHEALILVKDSQRRTRWYKTSGCVWEDASATLGDAFAYLASQYPKLQDFFIDRLGVKRHVDSESYALRWLALQEASLPDIEQQLAVVERLYAAIKPIALQPEADCPAWWRDFAQKLKIYTQADTFEPPNKVVLPDDGVYRVFFQGRVAFAWRPPKDGFGDWAPFYQALGTPLLSEAVTEHLEDDGKEHEPLPHNRFVTEAVIKMIATWLREKQKGDYDRLLRDDSFARLAAIREAKVSSDIKVEFRLRVDTVTESKTVTYPVFWKRLENILVYTDGVKKSEVAKVIAKGLLENRAYKDLAHWVELVLGASDTERLKEADWNVPQPILNLFKESVPIPGIPAPPMPSRSANAAKPAVDASATSADQPAGAPTPQDPAFGRSDITTMKVPEVGHQPQAPRSPVSDGHQHHEDRGDSGDHRHSHRDQAPEREDQPKNRPGKTNGLDSDGLSYADELVKAFNRGSVTHFDADAPDYASGSVKNPLRWGEKLKEGYREGIDNEPSPEERRQVTERRLLEGRNEAVRVSLNEWYHGKCQICGESWLERDGSPYFTAAYLVEPRRARWVDTPGNAICLCAKHFAQWRHAEIGMLENVDDQIRSLRLAAEGGDGKLTIRFRMLKDEQTITYNERHLLALRTLIEVASEAGR